MTLEFWLGLFGGAILGFVTNWLFHLYNKEQNWDEQFIMDKQNLSRFLEKVKFEIELIIEKTEEHEQDPETELKFDTILYFRRLLNEDPFTLSFGDKNFESSQLKPVREARDLVEDLKDIIVKGEFNKNKLKKINSNITLIRMALIRIKV